jgi:hypothetical protein
MRASTIAAASWRKAAGARKKRVCLPAARRNFRLDVAEARFGDPTDVAREQKRHRRLMASLPRKHP